ncbi:MAG: N-acetyltransferase [Chloracidobacterium sp. CP2_5A]|nr:MAG: N-acetyltransferase [Chloracidobacterium sp. CP2_5A]
MSEELPYRKHPTALVESDRIGRGTRIWAFAHVLPGAVIGDDCNIGDHCYIESGAIVGNRVTIKNGVSVWDGVQLGDDVFLGPNVALTNDLLPRSRKPDWVRYPTYIERGATVGANATIVCRARIGEYAMIGAGSVITRDVPPHALCFGNPATIRGWACRCGARLTFEGEEATCRECGDRYWKFSGGIARIK